jgi:hypothetical protein
VFLRRHSRESVAKAGTQGKRYAAALEPRFSGGDGQKLGLMASFRIKL